MKHIKVFLTCMVFVAGFLTGAARMWHGSPIFLAHFRGLPKDRQISLLRSIGVRSSPFAVRTILLSAYPNQPPEAHELAHLIGETAYAKSGRDGFVYCDSSFTFACYHGVILAALRIHGYDEAMLQELAKGCDNAGRNDTAKVSCAHGIGHGIMWVKNYALVPSFELCDRIFSDGKLRFFCWDGVAMENVVRRGETAQKLPVIPWKDGDIYYPCDSIPAVYEAACVREHLFLLRLTVFKRDTEKSIEYCMYFTSTGTREECFGALGGAVEQDDPLNLSNIATECQRVPSPYNIHCIGRAATQYAFSAQKGSGLKLCETLHDIQMQKECTNSVNTADASRYIIQE